MLEMLEVSKKYRKISADGKDSVNIFLTELATVEARITKNYSTLLNSFIIAPTQDRRHASG